MFCLHVCMYVYRVHACCLQMSEEGVRPLDLDLEAVVSYRVGAGDCLWSFAGSSSAHNVWLHFQPMNVYFSSCDPVEDLVTLVYKKHLSLSPCALPRLSPALSCTVPVTLCTSEHVQTRALH